MMFWRFNVFRIIIDHFKTFYDFELDNPYPPINRLEAGLVGLLPMVAATYLTVKGICFPPAVHDSILNALALLCGMLLNLLAIAQSMIGGFDKFPLAKISLQSLRDTIANLSYGILVSLSAIAFNIAVRMNGEGWKFWTAHWLLYVALLNLGITLLVILSNIHVLAMKQIRDRIGKKNPSEK